MTLKGFLGTAGEPVRFRGHSGLITALSPLRHFVIGYVGRRTFQQLPGQPQIVSLYFPFFDETALLK